MSNEIEDSKRQISETSSFGETDRCWYRNGILMGRDFNIQQS